MGTSWCMAPACPLPTTFVWVPRYRLAHRTSYFYCFLWYMMPVVRSGTFRDLRVTVQLFVRFVTHWATVTVNYINHTFRGLRANLTVKYNLTHRNFHM
jgi:hypothetical protein